MVSASLAVLCLSVGLSAQQSKAAAVVEQLDGPVALGVANAAAEARELVGVEVTKALRRALVAWRDREGAEARSVRLLLLDALIRHDVKLPGDLLLPMLPEPEVGTAAFVLLCRSAARDEAALLQAYQLTPPDSRVRRQALGNLLVELRSPLFAEELLRAGALRLRVLVGDRSHLMVALPDLDCVVRRASSTSDGFPEPPGYVLERAAMPSYRTEAMRIGLLVEVAPGVRAMRTQPVQQPALQDFFAAAREHDVNAEQRWLQELSGVPLPPHVLLVRGDDQNFAAKVERARDRTRAANELVLAGLSRNHLISAERAAESRAADVFELVDQRTDRATPLPAVAQR